MTEPYRRPDPPHPRRRLLVLVLGALVTALVVAGVTWSVFMWPVTCGTTLAAPGASTPGP